MSRAVAYVLIAGCALTSGGAPARAEGVAVEPLQVEGIEEINSSLKKLLSLLEVQVANQKTQLAVQRLDISRRDIIARESELHDALTRKDDLLSQQSSLELHLRTLDGDPEATGLAEVDLERVRSQARLDFDGLKQRIWRLDQRILDLQAELRRAREDLEAWEELVSESLR